MPALVSLLVSILVLALVLSCLWWILTLIPAPPPVATILRIVFAVLCLIALMSLLFGGWAFPVFGHRVY